jgi:hypothetical protein
MRRRHTIDWLKSHRCRSWTFLQPPNCYCFERVRDCAASLKPSGRGPLWIFEARTVGGMSGSPIMAEYGSAITASTPGSEEKCDNINVAVTRQDRDGDGGRRNDVFA